MPKKPPSKSKRPKVQSTNLQLIFLILPVVLLALFVSSNITTARTLSVSTSANVLGDDEDKSGENMEEKKEEEKKKEETKSESEKKKEEQKKEETSTSDKSSINTSSTLLKSKTQKEKNKQETEIETSDGQKIKTKVEDDGTTKIELEQGNLKLKYVFENGVLKLKAENESGEEVEVDEEKLDDLEREVEEELEEEGLEITTESGKIALKKGNTTAHSNFPLSINPATGELIVTTPAGSKVVTILPDQAIENLLRTGIVNIVESAPPDNNSTPSSQLSQFAGKLEIVEKDNHIMYKIKGEKEHKIFGLLPVEVPSTIFVSAENGEVLTQERSLLGTFIDFLSP